jgi:hypothetical protein
MIKAVELLKLGRDDVFEGAHKTRVKDNAGNWVPQQITGESRLMLHQESRAVRC